MRKNRKKPEITSPSELLLLLLLLLADAFIVLLCVEAVRRASLPLAVDWVFRYPLFSLMSAGLLFSLLLFAVLLTRRVSLAVCVVNLLAAALALVSVIKISLRNEPVLFTDISLIREALQISGGYRFEVDRFTLFMLGIPVLPVLCTLGLRLPLRRLLPHAAEALAGFGLFCLFCFAGLRGFNRYAYRQMDLVQEDGVIGGILATVPQAAAPEGYSEEAVKAALHGAVPQKSDAQKPDIFFIMCESLYDLGRLPGVTLSADPLAHFRALQQEGWGGNLVVGQFGGGTAETEYEVLTGYRARDLSGAAYVTPGILKDGMRTIPTLLESLGYSTQFVHPGDGAFYNRRSAMKKLGFGSAAFLPELGPAETMIGGRPADSWLFPLLFRRWQAQAGSGPLFTYVTTFQNHGGYDDGTDVRDIRVDGVPREYANAAENYVNGVHLTDESLAALCDSFRNADRPVVLVVFGDHAPSLDCFGISTRDSDRDLFFSYTTPLLIWSNFGFRPSVPDGADVSCCRLGALLLHDLGFTEDAYYNSLVDAPSLMKQEGCIARGGVIQDADAWQAENERLWLLHYDRVFGKGFSLPGEN